MADAQARDERKQKPEEKMVETVYLDTYDDIFSDFDYGPHESRRVSEDFLVELEERLKYVRFGRLEVLLIVPDAERKREVEAMTKKRIRSVFSFKLRAAEAEIAASRRTGIYRCAIGFSILALEWLLLTASEPGSFLNLLSLLIAPAGWYGAFSGIERFFDPPKSLVEKKRVYSIMAESAIVFEDASKLARPPTMPAVEPPKAEKPAAPAVS